MGLDTIADAHDIEDWMWLKIYGRVNGKQNKKIPGEVWK